MFRDVTWEKQAERELRESAKRLHELADAMPQLIWKAPLDGLLDYRNKRCKKFSGLVRGSSGFREWNSTVHPEDLQITLEFMGNREPAGASQVEHRMRVKSGAYRWYLSRRVAMHDEQDRVVKWIGTSTDIHQLKGKELRLREHVIRLENAINQWAYFRESTFHELRELLQVIDWFSRLLLEKNRQVIDPESRQMIKTSGKALER